jgi:tRNA (cmo5U34)-methyltransferase
VFIAMSQHDSLFQQRHKIEDFVFDERVARVFDSMVSRSVPFYHHIQQAQSELIMDFLPESGGVVCDLGCSTGTTIDYLSKQANCPSEVQFIGYDNSEAMLNQAKKKLAEGIANNKVILQCADLSALTELPACNVVILNWTLQFVRPIERESLLKMIYQSLQPNGILLLSEKILSPEPLLNRLYIDHYLRFKKAQGGYSDIENQRKREALENVLVPYRLDENIALLKRAGFAHVDTYFQWFNFACLIAVK